MAWRLTAEVRGKMPLPREVMCASHPARAALSVRAKALTFGGRLTRRPRRAMNIEEARFNMIEQQIRPWDVLDSRVLETLRNVPREDFVPEDSRSLAFADLNIRLPHDQVMMQPKVEARLLQELALGASDRVLEIGTGSGYMTALLASLAGEVDSVEIFPEFIDTAREKLAAHDITSVNLIQGDGAHGWKSDIHYDAIILTGSVSSIPDDYCALLQTRGRLVAIVGADPVMEAVLVTRLRDGSFDTTSLFATSLPPLIGAAARPRFTF